MVPLHTLLVAIIDCESIFTEITNIHGIINPPSPWISPLLKYLLKKQSKAMASGNAIKVKELTDRVSDVIAENRKNWGSSDTYRESQQWWRKVDNISLRKRKTQFVLDDNFLESVNDFFRNLCHDSEYVEPDYLDIDPAGHCDLACTTCMISSYACHV